ncbi:DUF2812 domain-containing protein [Bariatricus sp. SGI.154]|uniref:DUF2812 domain-containing protein n=1 Tax=Bariatricus sp. SGI.154 TaxID=3420549 RepID=UPI003CFD82A2
MGKLKTSHKAYAAWDYGKEIEDLNQKSREGWQLVKGGCFRSVFEQDEQVVYRYQLDYNTDIENRMRYIETFREQGWEYMNSTFNGWHYFRKPYDPELPEEEYEIYTDSSGLSEMEQRWTRLATILLIAMSIMGITMLIKGVQYPEWPRVPMILLYLDFIVFIGIGLRRLKKKDKEYHKVFPLSAMVYIAVVCWIVGVMLSVFRPDVSGTIKGTGSTRSYENFKVSYPDNYYLDLTMDNEIPCEFQIVDQKGDIVYSNQEEKVEEESIQLRLSKGTYQINIVAEDDGTGGNTQVAYELN